MDIINDWKAIKILLNKAFKSNFHVSIASVDEQNCPTVTPIGTLFLNDHQKGFYFEKFPSQLPRHADANKRICVLAVNSYRLFWLKSLFRQKFVTPPAIKLYGSLGKKRRASERELERLNRRMRITKGLKGNTYLWKKMEFVREIQFDRVETINLGKMTDK